MRSSVIASKKVEVCLAVSILMQVPAPSPGSFAIPWLFPAGAGSFAFLRVLRNLRMSGASHH